MAQGIAGQASVGALITGTYSLDLQPGCHLKPLGSTSKLEPEEELAGTSWGCPRLLREGGTHQTYLHRDVWVIPWQLDVQTIFPPLNGGHRVGKHLTAKDHVLPGHIPNVIWV